MPVLLRAMLHKSIIQLLYPTVRGAADGAGIAPGEGETVFVPGGTAPGQGETAFAGANSPVPLIISGKLITPVCVDVAIIPNNGIMAAPMAAPGPAKAPKVKPMDESRFRDDSPRYLI